MGGFTRQRRTGSAIRRRRKTEKRDVTDITTQAEITTNKKSYHHITLQHKDNDDGLVKEMLQIYEWRNKNCRKRGPKKI